MTARAHCMVVARFVKLPTSGAGNIMVFYECIVTAKNTARTCRVVSWHVNSCGGCGYDTHLAESQDELHAVKIGRYASTADGLLPSLFSQNNIYWQTLVI